MSFSIYGLGLGEGDEHPPIRCVVEMEYGELYLYLIGLLLTPPLGYSILGRLLLIAPYTDNLVEPRLLLPIIT